MEKISYEDWQNIKIKIEQGRTLEKNERKFEEFIKKGNKYTRVIENILKENNANSFLNSSKSKRFAITIAGIVVNVLFGFLIYFIY